MARRKKTNLRSPEQETTSSLQSQEGSIVEKEARTTTTVVRKSRKKSAGPASALVEPVAVVEAMPNVAANDSQQVPDSAPAEKTKRQRRKGTRGEVKSKGNMPPTNPILPEAEPKARATLADLFAETEPPPKRTPQGRKPEKSAEQTPTPAQILSQLVEDIDPPGSEETPPATSRTQPRRQRRKTTDIVTPAGPAETAPVAVAILPEAEPRKRAGRTRQRAAAPETIDAEAKPAEVTESDPVGTSGQPAKTRRRSKAPEREKRVTRVKEETLPPYISRHPLVRVHFQHGVPYISSGEHRLKPFLFFGNPQTSAAEERVFKQMMQASQVGVSLYSLLLTLRIDNSGATETLGAIRYWTRLVQDINPDAYFLWRIVPVPSRDWQQQFPEAVPRFADGTIGQPSVCAGRWWQEVEKVMFNLVRTVEENDEGERILGYHLDRGEWFYSESSGYDTSVAALEAFREWLRKRYANNIITLRAAWHDGSVTFNSITIPSLTPHSRPDENHFYEPRRGGRWIDYHQFLSEATAECILSLARCVRNASGGRVLCGTSYGYLFEWAHPYSGHFALNKLVRSEDIHFISAPPTYLDRMPGGTGAPSLPIDSVRLHHKLFLSEEDYATPFGAQTEPDDYNPPMKSSEAVEQVQMRGLGSSLAFATGTTWMDLWGNGWLDHPAVWQRAMQYERSWEWRTLIGQTEPEVAVLIDEASLSYAKPRSPLIRELLTGSREALLRSGASVGFYLLEDVLRRDFPQAKMIVFLNAWNLSQPVREAIRTKLHGDHRTLVWLYAASLFDGHRSTLETARDVMGIALEKQPWASTQGTQLLTKLHPITAAMGSDRLGTQQRWEPSFYALADEATALGEYIETGLPSIALKEHEDWKAVFIGERSLTPELLRGIYAYAGVHIWNHQNDLTHARAPWLHIHAREAGNRVLTFPERCSVYDLQAGEILAENTHQHRLFMQEGESKLLIAAPAAALESLLKGEKWLPKTFIEMLPPEPEEPEVVGIWDSEFEIQSPEVEEVEDKEAVSSLSSPDTDIDKPKKTRRKRKGRSKPASLSEPEPENDANDGLSIQVEWRR